MKIFSKPRQLFIIDGIGALTSALLLGVVLVRFESVFGIPQAALLWLATFPVLFAVFDLLSYKLTDINVAVHLKIVSILNILYCLFSLIIAYFHQDMLSIFGWIYIFSEITILLLLARIEWKASSSLKV